LLGCTGFPLKPVRFDYGLFVPSKEGRFVFI